MTAPHYNEAYSHGTPATRRSARERIAADVAAWLEAGNQVEELPAYVRRPTAEERAE